MSGKVRTCLKQNQLDIQLKSIIHMSYQDDAKTTKVVADCTGDSSWEICHRCAKILLAVEHKMQLA